MEEYHNTSRFILTCNYPNRIIPALHSRCQGYHIERIDQTEFTARVTTILVEEQVDVDLETLDLYVKATNTDLRKCINVVQQNVTDNKLQRRLIKAMKERRTGSLIWLNFSRQEKLQMHVNYYVVNFVQKKWKKYRWLYDNIAIFGDEDAQDKAVLIIKQGLVDHTLVADQEINLAAVLIKLGRL